MCKPVFLLLLFKLIQSIWIDPVHYYSVCATHITHEWPFASWSQPLGQGGSTAWWLPIFQSIDLVFLCVLVVNKQQLHAFPFSRSFWVMPKMSHCCVALLINDHTPCFWMILYNYRAIIFFWDLLQWLWKNGTGRWDEIVDKTFPAAYLCSSLCGILSNSRPCILIISWSALTGWT